MINSKETSQLPIGASVPASMEVASRLQTKRRGRHRRREEGRSFGIQTHLGFFLPLPPGDAAQGPEVKLMQM